MLVDGSPRVSCVTPTRRVAGRKVTTLDGLDPAERDRWADLFCATGASQCGFCTPGIIVRLAGLDAANPDAGPDHANRALAAHLCRCTGWQTITEAWDLRHAPPSTNGRDLDAAGVRAEIEGGVAQSVSPAVALGHGGFADDSAPADALVAVRADSGDWVVAETLHQARLDAGKIQGRRTTLDPVWPVEIPPGDWAATLSTTWVEPAYLETDAAWARPGEPAQSPLGNGGGFGAKLESPVTEVAERLAAEHGRPVRVLMSREDTIRLGPKRPPVAGGANADGTGVIRIVATPGIESAVAAASPGLRVELVEVPGELATSAALRGAGWAEATALVAMATGRAGRVTAPGRGWAEAHVDDDHIAVQVGAGEVLDPVTLRSYCIGAAHMAYSMVMHESLTVDRSGLVQDLTVRSFGVCRAADLPEVRVEIADESGAATNGSDAVFAAVMASTAVHYHATRWPHRS